MSQALAKMESPIGRPPGVTLKQWRLAQLLPRAESAYQALIQAGYKPSTGLAAAKRTYETIGVRNATKAIQQRQADSARGIYGLGQSALSKAADRIDDLDTREKLQFGLAAVKLAHEVGENVEQSGDSNAWKRRLRRALILMARLTEQRVRRELTPNP